MPKVVILTIRGGFVIATAITSFVFLFVFSLFLFVFRITGYRFFL